MPTNYYVQEQGKRACSNSRSVLVPLTSSRHIKQPSIMNYKFLSYTKRILLISGASENFIQSHIVEELTAKLKQAGIVNIEHQENVFSFRGPIFRWSWNGFDMLNIVSRLELRFEKLTTLPYLVVKFVYTELLIIALLMSTTIVIASLTGILVWAIGLGLVILASYVTSTVVAASRFEKWIQKELKTHEHLVQEQAGDRNYDEKPTITTTV